MALKNYKAVKEFERNGVIVKGGEELVLTEREGEKLVKERCVMEGRVLDPADPRDLGSITMAEAEYDQKYEADMAKEEARDEKKDKELKEDDKKRGTLVAEATQIIIDKAAEEDKIISEEELKAEVEKLQRLETSEIEKHVEDLRGDKKEDPKEEEESENEEEVPKDTEPKQVKVPKKK